MFICSNDRYCFMPAAEVTPELDYFRVGYGESVFPKALDALIAFVEKRKRRWSTAMATESERKERARL